MHIPENYRKPILFAVIFHVILLCVLIFSFAPSLFRMPPSSAPMKTVHATAVSEASVQAETHQAAQEDQKLMHAQQAAAAHQKLMREREREIKIAQQKSLVLQQQKMAAQQAAAAQQKLIRERERVSAAHKLKLAAHQKLMRERERVSIAHKLQQEMMQQQMTSEQKNISAVVSQAQQGMIDKYKAEILSAIQSNWRIDQINAKLKCIYTVQVAPDGTVLSIKLVQSSGDSALDQSAQQAITLASPLPVPHNPVLFNHFRQLVLTLSPQGVLQSVGTA